MDIAVKTKDLTKCYKIYNKPVDRLKESLNPFRRKYHRDFFALNNISFNVKRGETVGIIGKNGSGKSTLLKLITGVLTPSDGNVVVNGKISALLELGAGFNPEFTGIENIYMNGTIMGFSKAEMDKKLQDIIDFADIGDFINQPVKMYSSGMFARLAFAVAINIEPDILIVDEALSVGDVFFQNKCFKKFKELRDKKVTILFVSHDMGSVKQMTERVLWLDSGKQKMFDDTEIVCEAYFNEQLLLQNEINRNLTFDDNAPLHKINTAIEKGVFPKLVVSGKPVLHDDVIIKSFYITENNNILEYLRVDNQYKAVFVVEFSRKFDNIILGFVLENNKGIQVLGINSFINNDEHMIMIDKKCVLKVEFTFVLPRILKGEYLLSPAVAQGSQNQNIILTWLPAVKNITIENTGYNLSLLEIPSNIEVKQYDINDVRFL